MTDEVNLYKLHVGMKTGAASWSDVEIYEGYESFLDALFQAAVQSAANNYRGHSREDWISISTWNNKVMNGDEDGPKIDRIIKAQKFVDGKWVDLKFTLHPPRIELNE